MGAISKEQVAIVNRIFKQTGNDLSYIMCNDELLQEHIKFIQNSEYSDFSVKRGLCNLRTNGNKKPKKFKFFRRLYTNIYDRWIHMIRSCYDKKYQYYKFIGAKGIKIDNKFLDGKYFCIWCLKNGLIRKQFKYDQYLIRKDKTKNYTEDNLLVLNEKELHNCKTLSNALVVLKAAKLYEESHDPTVSYMTFYTRYFLYDLDDYDARNFKYITLNVNACIGFSARIFYKSVADENCCSYSLFLRRMHEVYLIPGFNFRPYDMLKPEYSIAEAANKFGLKTYKQIELKRKEKNKSVVNELSNIDKFNNDVYNFNEDSVYKE